MLSVMLSKCRRTMNCRSVLLGLTLLLSLVACDPENNPTTMKGRTITPARLPKVQPVRLPKVPESVREQLTGRPTPSSTQGDPTHDHKTTLHHGPNRD